MAARTAMDAATVKQRARALGDHLLDACRVHAKRVELATVGVGVRVGANVSDKHPPLTVPDSRSLRGVGAARERRGLRSGKREIPHQLEAGACERA